MLDVGIRCLCVMMLCQRRHFSHLSALGEARWRIVTTNRRRYTYLGQFTQMVSIQEQLLQTARVSKYFFWNAGQRAMSFVDELDLPIAAFKYWNALEHFHYNLNESIDTLLFCSIPGDIHQLSTFGAPTLKNHYVSYVFFFSWHNYQYTWYVLHILVL